VPAPTIISNSTSTPRRNPVVWEVIAVMPFILVAKIVFFSQTAAIRPLLLTKNTYIYIISTLWGTLNRKRKRIFLKKNVFGEKN
jgi:hypothetical protein